MTDMREEDGGADVTVDKRVVAAGVRAAPRATAPRSRVRHERLQARDAHAPCRAEEEVPRNHGLRASLARLDGNPDELAQESGEGTVTALDDRRRAIACRVTCTRLAGDAAVGIAGFESMHGVPNEGAALAERA